MHRAGRAEELKVSWFLFSKKNNAAFSVAEDATRFLFPCFRHREGSR
jgi:hypothetical protein